MYMYMYMYIVHCTFLLTVVTRILHWLETQDLAVTGGGGLRVSEMGKLQDTNIGKFHVFVGGVYAFAKRFFIKSSFYAICKSF